MTITFDNTIQNSSLQVGDFAYFIPSSSMQFMGGQQTAQGTPELIGKVTAVGTDSISINEQGPSTPNADDFILFAKDNSVNQSGLKGYYASVTMSNNSKEKIELYAVSSEVAESSK